MQFDVSIQGKPYKTIEASNTGAVLFIVAKDIGAGLVPDFNPAQPHDIVIRALPPDPFEKWASVAPQNPERFTVWLAPDETEWIYDQPRDANGRYLSDDPSTPERESALRWRPHTNVS
jgi:hypothetical protein